MRNAMKTRESGMPDEQTWSSFFSPTQTLVKLGLVEACGDVVDFGCGYGTFAIPAARLVRGTVHALDIEAQMVEMTARKAKAAGLSNVRAERRDFVADGTGLLDGNCPTFLNADLIAAGLSPFEPEKAIRRRYEQGWSNFQNLYKPLVDSWQVYDVMKTPPMLIDEGGQA